MRIGLNAQRLGEDEGVTGLTHHTHSALDQFFVGDAVVRFPAHMNVSIAADEDAVFLVRQIFRHHPPVNAAVDMAVRIDFGMMGLATESMPACNLPKSCTLPMGQAKSSSPK